MEIYFDDNGNQIPTEPKTVSWINSYIKLLLEEEMLLKDIYVCGEISNFKKHSTGHMYFTLKDESSEIRAVMFRAYASRVKFKLENGMKIVAHAKIGTYPQGGTYQLYVDNIQPDGIGTLHLAFEQLKEKLYKEGLFEEENKKPIPKFPKRIGIITSPSGAAVRDIINVATRRYPLAELVLYPTLVQGENASSELINAVEFFNITKNVDVIIIGRGGGSMEDLWAFNNEYLARAIFNSVIPVVSAVGHEVDFTICDFVADLRAPTPSAAAELVTPDLLEISNKIKDFDNRSIQAILSKIDDHKAKLTVLSSSKVLTNPEAMLDLPRIQLDSYKNDLINAFNRIVLEKKSLFTENVAKLNSLNPMSVLARGFALVYDENGFPIKQVENVKENDDITVKFANGKIKAKVISNEKEK